MLEFADKNKMRNKTNIQFVIAINEINAFKKTVKLLRKGQYPASYSVYVAQSPSRA